MKQAFEKAYWPLTESQAPARSYLEARQTEIERGDIRAETLTAVYSAEEDQEPNALMPVWSRTARCSFGRGRPT
eukprot:9489032-Pyramimonas_sp.AAC.1